MILALGIGVNIGMFSLVNGLLLRRLYERPDEVVGVYGRSTAPTGGYRGLFYPNYLDLREGTTDIFANLAASPQSLSVSRSLDPKEYDCLSQVFQEQV